MSDQTFAQADVDRIVGERLARDRQVRVLSEPRVYAAGSQHSFYGDAITRLRDPSGFESRGAFERLARYGAELGHEIDARTAEGRYIERVLREFTRVDDAAEHEARFSAYVKELRALTTGGGATASASGGAGAAVVTPYFLMSETALFRGIHRTFADQCLNLPLPPFGMQVYVPYFSTTDAVAQQAEQLAPPVQPVPTTLTTGGTVAAGTYTVAVTYVSLSGETLASATNTVVTTGTTSTITVPSPAAAFGATGWYAYVSQAGGGAGAMTRQQAAGSPSAIGANLTITAPPTNTGAAPPTANTSGQVTETDPATAFQGGQVVTLSGQVTATQQFYDRAGGVGGAADVLIFKDLQQRLDEKVDLYTINTVVSAAGTVSGAGSWTNVGTLYADHAKGREALSDTAGVRLRATKFFSTSDFYNYVSDQLDSSNRPVVTPQFFPGQTPPDVDPDDPGVRNKWSRFTGTVLPGGVLWFTDDNIPASGSNNQLVVSNPEESVVLLESPSPILSVFEQTVANNLEIVLNARKYVAVITRHAGGTQVISGGAYPTATDK